MSCSYLHFLQDNYYIPDLLITHIYIYVYNPRCGHPHDRYIQPVIQSLDLNPCFFGLARFHTLRTENLTSGKDNNIVLGISCNLYNETTVIDWVHWMFGAMKCTSMHIFFVGNALLFMYIITT